MPDNEFETIMRLQKVTFVKEIKKDGGKFIVRQVKKFLVWKPKELHEFLKEYLKGEQDGT